MAHNMSGGEFKELATKISASKASVLPPLYKPVKVTETDVELASLPEDQYKRRVYTFDGVTVRCAIDTSVPSDANRITVVYCESVEDLEVTVRGKKVVYPKGMGAFRIYPAGITI